MRSKQTGFSLIQPLLGLAALGAGLAGIHEQQRTLALAQDLASQRSRVSLALHSQLDQLRGCLATQGAGQSLSNPLPGCGDIPEPDAPAGCEWARDLRPGPLPGLAAVTLSGRWQDRRGRWHQITRSALIDGGAPTPSDHARPEHSQPAISEHPAPPSAGR